MKHVDTCDKCGKEYNPDVKEVPEENPRCDGCGAELIEQGSPSSYEMDSDNDDEHLVEKGLRKVTERITGNKR